jgi:superfamily II DNA/RNA helicase
MSTAVGRARAASHRSNRRSGPQAAGPAVEPALAAAAREPAPAATTFAELGLPAALVHALAGNGIHTPFAIQTRSLPDGLAGRDVLGQAQTGSGKTLAFGLPILARLSAGVPAGATRAGRPARALVLVPTRELAGQVTGVLGPLAEAVGLRVAAVYGGVSIAAQVRQLRRGLDVIVATPGRLLDLLDRGDCRLRGIEVTVLDEADHMADLGFLPAVTRILDATPAGGQRLLFSATLDRQVDRLVRGYLTNPAVHAVPAPAASAPAAEHRVYVLPAEDKVAVAADLAGRPGRTLFFVRTKHGATKLTKRLTAAGVATTAIHGNLNQNQRQRALAGFTAGRPSVLVATDVAARGIHVDDVDLVVHFDPPVDPKNYLHRSGRTARAGAAGTVLALAEPGQVAELARLHRAAGVTATTETLRRGDGQHGAGPASGPSRATPAVRAVPATPPVGRPAAGRRGRRPSGQQTARQQPVRSQAAGQPPERPDGVRSASPGRAPVRRRAERPVTSLPAAAAGSPARRSG